MPLFRQGGATVGLRTRLRAERDQGGSIFIGRFVEAKGKVNQAGCFGYSLVEMTFVVGQGVISLLGRCRGWKISGQGAISPR